MSDFDTSELQALSASLDSAAKAIPAEARGIVRKGALNIKNETRDAISDHPSWRHLAASVNYTVAGNKFFTSAVVGYDDLGQGELAGIAEFGSARHAPHPALMPAARAEAPRFEKAMADAAVKALRDAL